MATNPRRTAQAREARPAFPDGFHDAMQFPLIAAIAGRRSRRFARGAAIPDGELAYQSKHEPQPLDELEQLLLLTSMAGNTGWHYLIVRGDHYPGHLSNYANAAGGRTFPSGAGFHTSQLFYTDDDGTYLFDTRDSPSLVTVNGDGSIDLEAWLEAHRAQIVTLSDQRLELPRCEPHYDGHNTWCANVPGSTLFFPIGDNAQSLLACLAFAVQNGQCIYDDVNDRPIPGLEAFADMVDLEEPWPLTYLEREAHSMLVVELACCCYAGQLMLQAMGLGGWLFTGMNRYSVMGVFDPEVPGLGFGANVVEGFPLPDPIGRAGVFEALCPPNYPDMRAAVDAMWERKFGAGGPFHRATPGPFRDSPRVRGSAQRHDERFRECIALQAQYILDTFGKFPARYPACFLMPFLQAHHLDLEFYDTHFEPGAYLSTHARHQERWHGA